VDASAALFQAALGITDPWYIKTVSLDQDTRVLEIHIDFHRGSRFTLDGRVGDYPAYDTRIVRYRHLNFFQFQCELVVRLPRVQVEDRSLHEVNPQWAAIFAASRYSLKR
jgi:transposase